MSAAGPDAYSSFPAYPFRRPPELDGRGGHVPVAIAGGGPVGLTLALALARHGVKSVVIEPRHRVSFGSRAICLSRRSLEHWERIGVAEAALAKGLAWTGGVSFWREHEVFRLAMPHDADQKHPPMINLQQNWQEQILVDAALARPEIDLRWHSEIVGLDASGDGARLRVKTPEGEHGLAADWLVACDGARSFARQSLGLALEGTSYEGRYLIADIALKSNHPTERRCWFDPPSNPGSTVLMHRQPDDIWRIDYQLGDDEDAEAELAPERVKSRIEAHLAMIGEMAPWRLIWSSLYKAHCLTLPRYAHGRVLFAGDAAHLVPIFGVRGLNSGIDDAANLAWKLAAVLAGTGPPGLLDSYSSERVFAAHENIAQARMSTLFMTPPSAGHALMREAALSLAVRHDFARPLVNPRQTTAIAFPDSPLSTPDRDRWLNGPPPGATLPNGPVTLRRGNQAKPGHLLDAIGLRPVLYWFADTGPPPRAPLPFDLVPIGGSTGPGLSLEDHAGRVRSLLDAAPGAAYLVRPDGHVAARFRRPEGAEVAAALRRLYGRGTA
ncbi:FAD-dependent monooxygenase [Desertibaculum subflavum]|uniref:FAD-dependent monooxygenase n=1 Tax=Desertibaculum subflavum TaxID=2268458 RepID=UPI000E66F042